MYAQSHRETGAVRLSAKGTSKSSAVSSSRAHLNKTVNRGRKMKNNREERVRGEKRREKKERKSDEDVKLQ
ncbi:hypothetical protein RJT34_07808 [Clitoria ternatea]|uniref:Uncharacterized protein n=1 Tax=Clitoria ternatea TaxID=43366 RepID=A0AAN9K3T1_CLITE